MAVVTIHHTTSATGSGNGKVTIESATQIQIVDGTLTVNYFGQGFSYDGDYILGGTMTGTNFIDSANGGLQYEITGFYIDAIDAFEALAYGIDNFHALLLGGWDTVYGSPEDDYLYDWGGADVIWGGAGNDVFDALGLSSKGYVDTLRGGAGDDTYLIFGTGANYWDNQVADAIIEAPGEGIDWVVSAGSFTLPDNVDDLSLDTSGNASGRGNAIENLISGGTGNNKLEGMAGNDTLDGDAGDDTVDGGAGDDVLFGGFGNDVYVVDSAGDVLLDDGGDDTLQAAVSGYVLVNKEIEHLVLTGSAISVSGNAGANDIAGSALANQLNGLGGDDTLDGGAGNDTLAGGTGNDRYLVDIGGDSIVESADAGTDTVESAVSFTLAANVENLVLTGEAATEATGNAGANALTGNGLANVLDGKAGADTMDGGWGADAYYVDNAGDVVTDTGWNEQETDTVYTAASVGAGAFTGIEAITLLGSANLNATGDAAVKAITGNAGNNVLTVTAWNGAMDGGAGNDTLVGGEYRDTLDGGTGADLMRGGGGGDIYVIDSPGDVIDDVPPGYYQGENTVWAWISYAGNDVVQSVTLMGNAALDASGTGTLTGNGAANHLSGGRYMYGMDGDDTLSGEGIGVADLLGGDGDDTYVLDDDSYMWITELEDEGNDSIYLTLAYAWDDAYVDANIENIYLLVGGGIGGNASDNLIVANAGDNELEGGPGVDTLQGGAGRDTYIVDSQVDVIVELEGEGHDEVRVSAPIDFSIAAFPWIEDLHLTDDYYDDSDADINATGNALDNELSGTHGDNVLNGGAGNDFMAGGRGDDTYVVDSFGDVAYELDPTWDPTLQGWDTVRTTLTGYTLPDHIEHLVLLGNAATGSGNGRDNVIGGNASANTLDGGAGNDLLRGFAGNDTLTGGAGNDTLEGDGGSDTVNYSGAKAGYVITSASGVVTVSGSDGTDTLIGIDRISFNGQLHTLNANVASGNVQVSGLAREESVLTATVSSVSDADGVGTRSYQWFRDDTEIAGATSLVHTVVKDDVGAALSLRVRFIDGTGNTETLWSTATSAVTAWDTQPPAIVSITPPDKDLWSYNYPIVLEFNEDIVLGSGTINLVKADGTLVETFNVAWSDGLIDIVGSRLTYDPSHSLESGTGYRIEFGAGTIEDLAGRPIAAVSSPLFATPPHVATGGAGNDYMYGASGDDDMQGLGGNDTLRAGSGGNDILDGGAGRDTANLELPFSGVMSYSLGAEAMVISTTQGTKQLEGIERIQLSDAYFAFDTQTGGHVWQAEALLWAWNGSNPTQALLSQWTSQADIKGDMGDLAQHMINTYQPGMSATALVTRLYGTIIGVTPTAQEVALFAGQIGAGKAFATTADFLEFAASHPYNTEHFAGVLGFVQQLDPGYFL